MFQRDESSFEERREHMESATAVPFRDPAGAGAVAQASALQQRVQYLIQWAFNPSGRGPRMLRTLLIINPLIMFPLVVLMGGWGPGFSIRYFYALVIGETVSMTCFLANRGIALMGYHLFKTTLRRRTFILSSLTAMLPGLALGFTAARAVANALGQPWSIPSLADYGQGIVIGTLIVGIITMLDLWNTSQRERMQLENEALQAKLAALNAQLNPHLLFNALNTIAATIPEDPEAAEKTALKLSELYRGILLSTRQSSHPLSRELELCKAYLEVQSARFSDRLKWSMDLQPELESICVPPLLLQPLVENAVKHGISRKASGGWVRLAAYRSSSGLEILIDDDGVGFGASSEESGTGTGLATCRSRLRLTYGNQASLEIHCPVPEGGTRIRIRIPLSPGDLQEAR